MIRPAAVAIASIALLAAAPAADAAERCAASKRKGATVVERTREAVAWSRGAKVYGCAYSQNVSRRLPLGGLLDADRVGPASLALAGRFVAYAVERDPRDAYDDPAGHMLVFDLAAGAIELDRPAATRGSARVADIALKRSGSVAWTAVWCEPCRQQIGGVEVRGWDGRTLELLDSWESSGGGDGPYIEPTSLELSRDRRSVSWRAGTARRSAPLR